MIVGLYFHDGSIDGGFLIDGYTWTDACAEGIGVSSTHLFAVFALLLLYEWKNVFAMDFTIQGTPA